MQLLPLLPDEVLSQKDLFRGCVSSKGCKIKVYKGLSLEITMKGFQEWDWQWQWFLEKEGEYCEGTYVKYTFMKSYQTYALYKNCPYSIDVPRSLKYDTLGRANGTVLIT